MTVLPQWLPRARRERSGEHVLRLPFHINWTTLGLIGIVILAAVLRFANIGAIGQANTYYTAAVESMLQSWHNFFFVAAEPGGSVSIDKPPVGLWLQAISAYFLGVNGFAVVLPQILAGIASVVVLFHLVRRSFGNVAGLIAAFALAVTPVAIAVERNNTPDATLILSLLLAAWGFIKATETRKLRFLLLGALMIGIGFNIKMMQALLPLPAMYALYLFGSQQKWWRKIVHLGITTLVLIPIALSWATIVDLTPADQRPYVGSSSNNSAYNLIFGYNGVERLTGMTGNGSGGAPAQTSSSETQISQAAASAQQMSSTNQDTASTATQTDARTQRPDGGSGNTNGMFGTGQAGALRLFQSGLASQVSWLLPFGLMSIVAMACGVSWRRPVTERHRGLILWGGWLLTCAAFFSVASFFHQYYLAMLAAPLAAIVAMGVVFLWRLHTTHPVRAALLLTSTVGVTLAFQIYTVVSYGALAWWAALPVALGVIGVGLLLLSLRHHRKRLSLLACTLMVASLFVVPATWSGLTTAYSNSNLPTAYTGTSGRSGMPGGQPDATREASAGTTTQAAQPTGGATGGGINQNLLNYLEANTQDTKYLVVVPSSQAGAQYVLATGRPVLYAGGFSGSDNVIDGAGLAKLVADGEVKYVLWSGGSNNASSSISQYLASSCTVVTDASLGTATSATTQSTGGQPGAMGVSGGQMILYECTAS